MKYIKFIFRAVLVLLFLIVVLAILIPMIFKKDIVESIKTEVNKSVHAEVEFEDVSLSLFKDFPNIALSIEDISVYGIQKFEGIKMLSAAEISASADLFSLINSEEPIKINALTIEEADINIIQLSETEANYLISKQTGTVEGESSDFLIELEQYALLNSNISYDDRVAGLKLVATDINHTGSGDFTASLFDLDTKTEVSALSLTMEGISYLSKATASLDAKINIDNTKNLYTLKENTLRLNELELNVDGAVQLDGDDIKIKSNINAEKNQFKDFLSIIPNAFTKDFAQVKADGSTDINMSVKGIYNAINGSYPIIDLHLIIDNGYVKYPDLAKDISNLTIDLSLKTLDPTLQLISLNIPAFSMQIGNNPIAGFFKSTGNVNNPNFEAYVKGSLDLNELKSAFPIEAVDNMSGIIKMDATIDAKLSDIQNENYNKITFDGLAEMTDLMVDTKDYPAVNVKSSSLQFSPQQATLRNANIAFGKSNASLAAQINNPLAYLLADKSMSGNIDIKADYIDANQWITNDQAALVDNNVSVVPSIDPDIEKVINNTSVDYSLDFGQIDYEDYSISHLKSKGNIKANEMNIEYFEANMNESDINASGTLVNALDWVNNKAMLEGELTINSSFLDLNPFIVSDEENAENTSNQKYESPLIPDLVDINIKASADQVKYTNLDLSKVVGAISIKDNTAFLSNAKAEMLGGEVALEGYYATPAEEKSNFSLKSTVSKFDFGETFEKFITVQKLAPVAEYIDGLFNSSMVISGNLTDDLLPDLATLSASGFVETLNGAINGLAPINKVTNKLSLDEIGKNISIENTRNWFEIVNGVVEVKPFDFTYQDIDMKIAGTHSYGQDMEYIIDAKVPRELLKGSDVGALADKGLQFLESEAGKIGLNIDQGDYINLQINIGGSIKNPTLSIKPVSSGGVSTKDAIKEELTNKLDDVKEEAKEKAEEKIEETKQAVKDTVTTVVNTAKDSIETVLETKKNEVIDSVKTVVKEKVTDKIDSTVKEVITQETAEKILGKDLDKEKEKIKDALGKYNPFKKKK